MTTLLDDSAWDDRHEHADAVICLLDGDKAPDARDQRTIIEDLGDALPDYDVAQYFGSQPTIFEDYDHLSVSIERPSGRAVGLLGCKWMELSSDGEEFLYVWTAMLGHKWQRSGLFMAMVLTHFERIQKTRGISRIVATKTYNPAVYSILSRIADSVSGASLYPELPVAREGQPMAELAQRVREAVCPSLELDVTSGRVIGGQGVLAPDFFPLMPDSSDETVRQHFAEQLTRDDQILCVLELSPPAREAVLASMEDRFVRARSR